MGRASFSDRIYKILKRPNHAIVVSKDKNGWWVASIGIDWRVRVQGKGSTIDEALVNLFEECKRARDRNELSLKEWGVAKVREDFE